MAVAGFKRLGDKLGVGICGCLLVFNESFRHFKTTVTDWHFLFSNIDFRLTIENRLRPEQSKFENLKSKFLLAPGFPWRVRLHVQRRRPRDQRRNLKTRGGTGNKSNPTDFASGFGRARRFGSAIRPTLSLLDDFARLCAGRSRSFWEMRGQRFPDI